MANHYGETPARHIEQQRINVGNAAWALLQVGSAPLNNRRHIRYQLKSNPGGAMALAYANGVNENNSSGVTETTWTAPTTGASGLTTIPGNSIYIEPVGDNVQVYGRLVKKKGETDNSITVIVTEYA